MKRNSSQPWCGDIPGSQGQAHTYRRGFLHSGVRTCALLIAVYCSCDSYGLDSTPSPLQTQWNQFKDGPYAPLHPLGSSTSLVLVPTGSITPSHRHTHHRPAAISAGDFLFLSFRAGSAIYPYSDTAPFLVAVGVAAGVLAMLFGYIYASWQ